MGVKERRAKQKEHLRREILDAARELIVHEGYEQLSMRKIAEAIEYSPTTIYLYFKDKAELMQCLCDETFARLIPRCETLLAREPDPLEGLRKGMRVYIEFGLEHPDHYAVTFMTRSGVPMPPDALAFKAFAILPMMVGMCLQQGKIRPVDVEATSQALWAACHGVTSLLLACEAFPFVERDLLIDTTIDTMLAGLQP